MFAELNDRFCKPFKMKAAGCRIFPLMKFNSLLQIFSCSSALFLKGNKPKKLPCIIYYCLEEDYPFLPWSGGLQAGLAWDEVGAGTLPYLTWFDSLCQTKHLMERVGALILMERQQGCVWVVEWLFLDMEKGQPWHFPLTSCQQIHIPCYIS